MNIKSLKIECIDKSFPGVHALKDVSMEFFSGEVVSIVGQNGAGKSTMMNILGGVLKQDSGKIYIDGEEVSIKSPVDSQKYGISYIHQELTIFNNLTVEENISFNNFPTIKPFFLLNYSKIHEKCSEILSKIDPSIKLSSKVGELAVGQKQIVEICRAIGVGASLIIFDEPTSSLTLKEKENLFFLIELLKSQGFIVIYITHLFEEIFRISDRVYVLRDGMVAGETKVKETTIDEIIKMMLGKYIDKLYVEKKYRQGEDMLVVSGLHSTNGIGDISFNLRCKEVLGIWGLLGSGRTELIRALLNIDPVINGRVEIRARDNKFVELPKKFVKHFGYVPENRREEGLFLSSSVAANISIGRIQNISNKFGFIIKKKERKLAEDASKELGIKMVNMQQLVETLSGGNQQKVIIARWLMFRPDIFILDDPTKGLDIGAKADVHNLINKLVEEGISIIMISSDIDEILHMSDRIIILANKRITKVIEKKEASKELLMKYSIGIK